MVLNPYYFTFTYRAGLTTRQTRKNAKGQNRIKRAYNGQNEAIKHLKIRYENIIKSLGPEKYLKRPFALRVKDFAILRKYS